MPVAALAATLVAIAIGIGSFVLFQLTGERTQSEVEDPHLARLLEELSDAKEEYEEARDRLLESIGKLESKYGYDLSGPIEADINAIDARITHAVATLETDSRDVGAAGSLLTLLNSQIATISFTETLVRGTRAEEQSK